MRLSAFLQYIPVAFLVTTTCASPVGYNVRRHGGGQKVLITTEVVFTKTLTLEVDIGDIMPCTSKDPIKPTQTLSREGGTLNDTTTTTDIGTANLESAPSTTQSTYPLPTLTSSIDGGAPTTTSTQGPNSQPTNAYSSISSPRPTEATTTPYVGSTPSPVPGSSTSSGLPLPTYSLQYGGAEFNENVPLAIKRNKEFSNIKNGDKCDLEGQLLACEGTMGGSILQCGQGSKYEAVLSCNRGEKCFATPKTMTSGVSVTCDTEEAAAGKFGISVEELLQKIK